MKLRFEFLTVFRQKIGQESLWLQLEDRPDQKPTVLNALQVLDNSLRGKGLELFEGGRIAKGLLIFRRTSTGALERIRDPEDQRVDNGDNLVLSIAMEGG